MREDGGCVRDRAKEDEFEAGHNKMAIGCLLWKEDVDRGRRPSRARAMDDLMVTTRIPRQLTKGSFEDYHFIL